MTISPSVTPPAAGEDCLRFEGVSKTFPGVRALSDVTFGVRAGCVHALLGENGAGKSTLLKTLSGAHMPTAGSLRINGTPATFRNTADAIRAGVAVIYQELHLVPELSVAENLFLGHLPTHLGVVRQPELLRRAAELLNRFGEDIDPRTKVSRLPIGQRQMVEIAKALSRGAQIIAFDEPTSSLSSREVERLFAVIRTLQQEGRAILYVTHRMEEVYALCDSATVFRDGRHVRTWDSLKGVSPDELVKAMVGRELADIYNYSPRDIGPVALRAAAIHGPGLKEATDLTVRAGEILGIFGLVGAGRSELLRLLYGAAQKTAGSVEIAGEAREMTSPAAAIRAGLFLVPEDRRKEGIIPIRSVQENINLASRRRTALGKFIVRDGLERANALEHIRRLGIKTPSPAQLIMNLSGGNQQKAILARWLNENIRVLMLDEPTRGIDVGAKSEIYAIIQELARKGVGIIMVSSDLPEVLGLSDRVLIMRQGQIAGELPRSEATPERALTLALPTGT